MPFRADKDPVDLASPCIGVCRIEASNGLCRGCFRSIHEIRSWSTLDVPGKWALLNDLRQRRADAGILVRERVRRRNRAMPRARAANANAYLESAEDE